MSAPARLAAFAAGLAAVLAAAFGVGAAVGSDDDARREPAPVHTDGDHTNGEHEESE